MPAGSRGPFFVPAIFLPRQPLALSPSLLAGTMRRSAPVRARWTRKLLHRYSRCPQGEKSMMRFAPSSGSLVVSLLMVAARFGAAAEVTVPVTFSGGHETDRRDGGRPVALVAAGLGVPADVF